MAAAPRDKPARRFRGRHREWRQRNSRGRRRSSRQLTASTKLAGFTITYNLETMFSTKVSARGMIDVNRVLVPKRVAVRAVVMQESIETGCTGSRTVLSEKVADTLTTAFYVGRH